MTQQEIIRMAREAGFTDLDLSQGRADILKDFAALVVANEREKWEPAFNKHKPAPKIENGSVRFEAGLYTPLEVQLAIDLLTEREVLLKQLQQQHDDGLIDAWDVLELSKAEK